MGKNHRQKNVLLWRMARNYLFSLCKKNFWEVSVHGIRRDSKKKMAILNEDISQATIQMMSGPEWERNGSKAMVFIQVETTGLLSSITSPDLLLPPCPSIQHPLVLWCSHPPSLTNRASLQPRPHHQNMVLFVPYNWIYVSKLWHNPPPVIPFSSQTDSSSYPVKK